MKTSSNPLRTLATAGLAAGLSIALFACGGGYGGGDYMPPNTTPPATMTAFSSTGLAFNPQGFVWVAANGSDKSTLYDGNGVPQSLVVATPPAPTGIVYNASADFRLSANGISGASPFLFAGESGIISAWSPAVSPAAAVSVFDGSAAGSVYKGLAIASYAGANYLYAADFHNNRVDVLNASFAKVALPGGFVDPALPAGYAPFGIQAVGDRIYVAYAQREANGDDDVKGAGLGMVDVFDTGGTLIRQLVVGGALNAPWGLAMAPANFGSFSNMLLVANFGDGKINAYDPITGAAKGALGKADGSAIVIDGLWGIAFGNGLNSQPSNTLFFTAGPDDEKHGQYGRIDMK